MSLESERGGGNAVSYGLKIGVGIDDDRIFAAHFEDGALDPDLAGSDIGGNFVDSQADFTRSGERDIAGLGMRHYGIAKTGAGARAEIHHAFRHSRGFQNLDKFCRDGR